MIILRIPRTVALPFFGVLDLSLSTMNPPPSGRSCSLVRSFSSWITGRPLPLVTAAAGAPFLSREFLGSPPLGELHFNPLPKTHFLYLDHIPSSLPRVFMDALASFPRMQAPMLNLALYPLALEEFLSHLRPYSPSAFSPRFMRFFLFHGELISFPTQHCAFALLSTAIFFPPLRFFPKWAVSFFFYGLDHPYRGFLG